MAHPWWIEFWRLVGLLVLALVIGLVAGQVVLALLVAVLLYLGWQLRNLRRLEQWARGQRRQLPEADGVWGEVFYHMQRLRRKGRKRKKRLTAILSRFRESTAAMPDATVVLGEDGLIQWWNDAATRVLGLRYPQDAGQPLTNLVRDPAFYDYLTRGDFSEPVEFPSPAESGVMLSVRVIPYGNNQRLVVARDVTRLHRLEQMRRDFIANVSHELRTPLTVISGYLESLGDADDAFTRQWGRSLKAMQQQAGRMQQLVNDLLLLSRLETERNALPLEEVDVPTLLGMLREDAVTLGQGAHTVDLEADSELWLQGSGGELRSAFSNLINNAVRYTPEGGRITIRWYGDEAGAHFQVSDTGIGIAPQHIPRLTERFYRVDVGRSRESGGTGLGLAIVKHVLARHGGELGIESTVGEGSTFTCDFPPSLVIRRPAREASGLS